MINKNNLESALSIERINNYGEQYLGFTNEDIVFIPKLITKLANIFKEKIKDEDIESLTLKTVYDKYRIDTPDILNSLSHFEQECLNFQNDFNIKILDDKLFIDRFGFILLANNQDLINKNVFELDLKALKEVKTAILYNILTSMIYRAIFLKLKEESIEYSQMFKIVHERIFYYEKKFLERMRKLPLKKDIWIKVRSER